MSTSHMNAVWGGFALDLNFAGAGLVVVFYIIFEVVVYRLDLARIAKSAQRMGGSVKSISRGQFGTGWFADWSSRIYKVTYCTSAGEIVSSMCGTGMFTGVLWRDGIPPAYSSAVQFRCGKCGAPVLRDEKICSRCAAKPAPQNARP